MCKLGYLSIMNIYHKIILNNIIELDKLLVRYLKYLIAKCIYSAKDLMVKIKRVEI